MTIYRTDLAYIHKLGFGEFAAGAAPEIVKLLRRYVARGLVVELGCGAGVLSSHLLSAGYDVYGIDASRPILDYARRRAPGARFVVGSLFDAELPPCVAVAAIGEVLSYGCGDLRGLFGKIHRMLDDGGLLVFDVPEPGSHWEMSRHWQGDDWALLMDVELASRRRIVRRITTFRKIGKAWRRSHEVHELRLYPRAEMVSLLASCGFSAEASDRYGPFEMLRGRVAYVARKR